MGINNLSATKARSGAGGHFFVSDNPPDSKQAPREQPTCNGPVHTTCQIMRNVLASPAEVKIGALFLKEQEALPIQVTLSELGHTQPATTMQTENSTAAGFTNDTIKQKRSKAMDMHFYWINLSFIDNPAEQISVTTIPNTTRPVITDACNPCIYSIA
jgi:hypothetical protein